MNLVDVSKETLEREWRSLFATFGIDPNTMIEATNAEGEADLMPADQVEAFNEKELEEARVKSFDLANRMIRKPLGGLFKWQAPNWEVTDQELDELGEVYAALFAKHFPYFYQNPYIEKIIAFLDDLSEEIKALRLTYRIINKRKGLPLKKPKEGDQQNQAQENQEKPEPTRQPPKTFKEPDPA